MLPPATFHILLALAEEDRHGYAIIQDVAARTDGELKLSAGTLYRSIQRMLEQGLIAETRERPAPEDDDERRRYYRITPDGTAAARAEAWETSICNRARLWPISSCNSRESRRRPSSSTSNSRPESCCNSCRASSTSA